MRKSNDRKNFIWNTIGLTLYAIVSLILLIIVKRINGMDTAGVFTYAFSLSSLLFYVSLYYSRVYQIANYDGNKNKNNTELWNGKKIYKYFENDNPDEIYLYKENYK